MDTGTLVDADKQAGQELLDAFEEEGLDVKAILWLYLPESAEWRLLIATPQIYVSGPLDIYKKISRILRRKGLNDLIPLRQIGVTGPKDRIIEIMKRALKVKPGQPPAEVYNRTMNGIIIHGAYVYRL